jgi:hypothetical protein
LLVHQVVQHAGFDAFFLESLFKRFHAATS